MSKAVQPVQPSASPAIGSGPCMLLQLILGGKFQPLRSGKCRPKGLAHHITAHWKKTPFKNKNMVRIVKFDLVIMVSLCVLFFHSFLLLSNCRIVRRACMLSRTSLQNQFSFFFSFLCIFTQPGAKHYIGVNHVVDGNFAHLYPISIQSPVSPDKDLVVFNTT